MAVTALNQATVPASSPRASLVAALLLVAREQLPNWGGWPATVAQILALAGAGKTQAYDMAKRLRGVLPTLLSEPGRPAAEQVDDAVKWTVVEPVFQYLLEHPGAAIRTGERGTYADGFRRLVVGLVAPGQPAEHMPLEQFASAIKVPLGTLKEWLYPAALTRLIDTQDQESAPSNGGSVEITASIRNTHLRVIVELWLSWKGSFSAFCHMVRTEQRIRYSHTFIGNFLQAAGLRQRRPQRPVEAPWSSGTFRTLFPGAQWVGDGTALAIRWVGEVFVFNVELLKDVASDGDMGFTVSDTEDEEALRQAYEAALETSFGVPPHSLLLDNRPSNHSPGAEAGTPGTLLVPSTPGRGQSKAPVEGAFGLFSQAFPALSIPYASPREMARCVVHLILTAWYRGRNGKRRRRLQGQSPAEAYREARATPEEIRQAVAWGEEIRRRHELAHRTREARSDPGRLQLLKRGLEEAGITDPDNRLAVSLAYYSRDAIERGLAVFRAKQEQGTVPSSADPGRYLGGIIRSLHTRKELELISDHLLEQRIRLRDISLEPLQRAADRARRDLAPAALPQAFVDRALEATWSIDFRFWGKTAAEALLALPANSRPELYRALCRRIAATFKADDDRREDLIDWLAAATVLP